MRFNLATRDVDMLTQDKSIFGRKKEFVDAFFNGVINLNRYYHEGNQNTYKKNIKIWGSEVDDPRKNFFKRINVEK